MYRIRIIILMCALLPILTGLGFWQLQRYQEKQTLEQQYQHRQQGAYTVADLKNQPDPRYYRVQVGGLWQNRTSFLLDNRVYQGRVGYHLLTPLTTSTGDTVLVDRGWLQGNPDRTLPMIAEIIGPASITGLSWKPAGEPFLLAEDRWSERWPKLIQAIDLARMEQVLGTELQPWILVLDADQPGSLQSNFHLTNMPASRHMGYALQWFAMALALLILSILALVRERTSAGNKNNNKQEGWLNDKPQC